ncbi:MAG: hypothetical protein IMW97_07095 [Firmicutes bacterium]|nr:hypothetical protein [Candidatus Fermentithermobacillaceae bacterium]
MLQVIALNLLLLFKWRALREKSLTLLELARAILVGLAQLPEPLFKDSS